MKELNYRNLLLARESRGATQKAMAKAIEGLNQGNLSKMEKGLISISDNMLAQIANYLDYPVSFFYKPSQGRGLNTFFYRKRVTMPQKELALIEAKFDITRTAIDELLDSVDIPEFTIPSIKVSEDTDPKEIAKRIRIFFNLPIGPIDKIINTFEKHGVIVIFLKNMPDKFFGVTMFTNKSQPTIFINDNKSNDNKRFTLGHELGHLVMHLRNDVYDTDEKTLDKQADIFSSEFNMPEKECKNELLNLRYKDLMPLKLYWKLSKAAICYKAKELKCISDSQYKYYMMQLSKSGQRKKEFETVSIDKPTMLKKIIMIHLNDLKYTKNEIEQLTGERYDDLMALIPNEDVVRPKLRIIRNWE